MHVAAVALVSLLLNTAAPKASLEVTYWPHGRTHPATRWTLGCAPASGSHPHRGRACVVLAAHRDDLRPAARACTIFPRAGAPTAEIAGTYAGTKVDRGFRPGCPGWSDLRLVLTGR